MGDWQELSISQLGLVITGKTPSSKYPNDFGNETLFVTPSDYHGYVRFLNKAKRKLSAIGTARFKSKLLPENSVMVTCIGSDMGKVAMNSSPVITNQQINSIIPFTETVNPTFLYYALKAQYDTLRIYAGEGTAVPLINKTTFERITLAVPSLFEQESIAEVLSSLDDKIDLLQRNSNTLEALTETLFKQWFIAEAANNWKSAKLKEYYQFFRGLSYKGSGLCENNTPDSIMMVNLNSIYEGGGYKSVGVKHYNGEYKERHLVYPGELIVTNTEQGHDHRLIGYGAIVPKSIGDKAIFSQHIYRITPKTDLLSTQYLYYLLRQPATRDQLIGATNGSTVNMLPIDGIERAIISVPSVDKIQKFDEIAMVTQEKIECNQAQIGKLEQLRDTLLPKLMSGVITIKEIANEPICS